MGKRKKSSHVKADFSTPETKEERKSKYGEPKIIPKEIFEVIGDYVQQISPSSRNVFLTMHEFSFNEFVIKGPLNDFDRPSQIIVFCLRFIKRDHFNPLGIIQTNRRLDQTDKLVIIWKAFLEDLKILRLNVIASMSTSSPTFQRALAVLTKNPNLSFYTGAITYSVEAFKEIVHLYDHCTLTLQFQLTLFEYKYMYFITRPSEELENVSSLNTLNLYVANWEDTILRVMKMFLKSYFNPNQSVETIPQASIFSLEFRHFWKNYIENNFVKSDYLNTSAHLVLDMLVNFADFSYYSTNLSTDDIQDLYNRNERLRLALASMQWVDTLKNPPMEKDVFQHWELSSNDNLTNYEISDIVNRFFHSQEVTCLDPYELFLLKMVYDEEDLITKLCITSDISIPIKSVKNNFNSAVDNAFQTYYNSLKMNRYEKQTILNKICGNSDKRKEIDTLLCDINLNNNNIDKPKQLINNTSIRLSPTSDDRFLIPYETPIMPQHQCGNCTECTRKAETVALKASNDLNAVYVQTVNSDELKTNCIIEVSVDTGKTKNLPKTAVKRLANSISVSKILKNTDEVHKENTNPDISNELPKEIDYKEYRQSLLENLRLQKENNSNMIYRNRTRFNKLAQMFQDDCDELQVTTDWLCTFKGYLKLKEIMEKRQVEFVRSSVFSLEHIDFFVEKIRRKPKERRPRAFYEFIDGELTFDVFRSGKGVLMITLDDNDLKILSGDE